MVKRKANACWVNGPMARKIVEAPLIVEVVEDLVEDIVADSGVEEEASAALTSKDTVQRLDEVEKRRWRSG